MAKAERILAAAIALTAVSLFALQQAPFVIRGDYRRDLVWESASPDKRYRLEVRRQATFPAFDILDPSGTAYFSVFDTTSRGTTAAKVPLNEIFDFQRPDVVWEASHVQVTGFDESDPAAVVRLLLPQ